MFFFLEGGAIALNAPHELRHLTSRNFNFLLPFYHFFKHCDIFRKNPKMEIATLYALNAWKGNLK